jgi:murein DD-endopeptidase MepM/ murein hydrolase activator NlpD
VTPVRLVALVLSLVLLVGAVWLVFVGVPNNPTPPPTNVASVPSPGATAAQSSSTGATQPAGSTQATGSPGLNPDATPGASAGASASAGPSAAPTPGDPLLKEVPAHSVDPGQLTGYMWPVDHAFITTRFAPLPATDGGFVIIDGVAYHDGVDLATHCNDTVQAAHDGTVLYAGRDYDPYLGYEGNAEAIYDRLKQLGRTNEQAIVVVVDDGNGYRSVYVHLNEADVEPGQVLSAGDKIGLEGATGFATGCHLHYGLIRMDGPWQPVVGRLLQYGYPPLVRERVNPLDVLPWADPNAPQVLQDKVNPPTPTPISSTEPSASPELPTDSPGPSSSPPTN